MYRGIMKSSLRNNNKQSQLQLQSQSRAIILFVWQQTFASILVRAPISQSRAQLQPMHRLLHDRSLKSCKISRRRPPRRLILF